MIISQVYRWKYSYTTLDHKIIQQNFPLNIFNVLKNKPAVQAAGAHPSRWSSTSRQNPPIQQIRRNFSLFYDWKHHF